MAGRSSKHSNESLAQLTEEAQHKLLHELQVHQIELELQNGELRLAQLQMEEAKRRYFDLYDMAPVGYCVASESSLVLEANLTMALMLGVTRNALAKKPLTDFIVPEDQDIYYLMRRKLMGDLSNSARPLKPVSCELRLVNADTGPFWVLLSATVEPGQSTTLDQDALQLRLTLSDINDRKLSYSKIEFAANVFDHAREGIFITHANGDIIDVNVAFTRITGYSREEVLGKNPRILSSGLQDASFYREMWNHMNEQGHWSGELWNRRKDGGLFACLQTISAVIDNYGKTKQFIALFSDISTIKAHESHLEHIAHFDALTSLPNRILLSDRLLQGMSHALRRGDVLAVVYLDLDGFKAVNDRHGHHMGDDLLIALASRMKDALRDGDTLARIGGDEFVAVLTDLEDSLDCLPLLNRLLDAAAMSVTVGDIVLHVSASLGVTFYPQATHIEPDQLLRQADQAMYQAKMLGRNRYHIFDAKKDSLLRVHHEELGQIKRALVQQEFVLYYQPKVNLRTGQIIGVEALIRWQHPQKGLLAPENFLPVIEDDELAVSLGEWVIGTALKQVEQWKNVGVDLPVSVNIGARQLQQDNFMERLHTILSTHPLVKPSYLALEILETSALSDMVQVSKVIDACAQIGIVFALDDFGTGYSSLTYLKRLHVPILKIDQSFVRDMLKDPENMSLLQGIIGMARAFKRVVIAEGVEDVAHGVALLQLGCELVQGNGIARPMPAAKIPDWVANWRPDTAWRSPI